MLMTKKKHRVKFQELRGRCAQVVSEVERDFKNKLAIRDKELEAYAKRWGSADGKVVLNAFQDSLRFIIEYQKSLAVLQAADPNYVAVDKLLERWGMQPYTTDRIVAGFTDDPTSTRAQILQNRYKTRWQQEEERWGEEAYSKGTVEIKAERTDEGDRVWFEEVANEDADEYEGEQVDCKWDDYPGEFAL